MRIRTDWDDCAGCLFNQRRDLLHRRAAACQAGDLLGGYVRLYSWSLMGRSRTGGRRLLTYRFPASQLMVVTRT
jgi:hypothetical protein